MTKTIGRIIQEQRNKKGYTQEIMAELLNMSVTNYAYIEQGKVIPSLKRLEQIAEKLEISVLELLAARDKNVYYIGNRNQNGGSNNSYIINAKLPEDYQEVLNELEKAKQENSFLKEKVNLLESKIADLQELIGLLKQK